MNTLFPVVNFLKCVVTEVVLFSVVAFKTFDISQGSVATHLSMGVFTIGPLGPCPRPFAGIKKITHLISAKSTP